MQILAGPALTKFRFCGGACVEKRDFDGHRDPSRLKLSVERQRSSRESTVKMEGEKQEKILTIDFEDSVNVDINRPSDVPADQAAAEDASSSPKKPSKVEKAAKTCPVDGVTVFLDRAEVKRLVEVDLKQGENEILITELPDVMDEDSIRFVPG